jgi:hypothetical protein
LRNLSFINKFLRKEAKFIQKVHCLKLTTGLYFSKDKDYLMEAYT